MFKGNWKIAIAALAALTLAAPAMAGSPAGKTQLTYVQHLGSSAGISDLQMPGDRIGKIKIKTAGSFKDGEGGLVTQIAGNAKLTCASNPDSKGLCGPKGSPTQAISVSTWTVLGALEIVNMTRLNVTGGKITFVGTGKNKFNAGGNVAASTIYNTAVVQGYNTINDLGSDPDNALTGCDAGPTVDKTTCASATASMGAGFMFGEDQTNTCDVDSDCDIITLICGGTGYCAVQTCTVDGDCNSGNCNNETGNCCDPASTAGCPDPSPSGAFLDANVLY